ncbi:3-isopropylmalate dehydrogenase-like protein [Colletotrichum navitas]|uniref:3-isopropylmalate dehydrogenase n=1 Tax=Colletotrichum navitas TaxID=681940 RepID=A0AAD8PMU5_9PEZI|nr:3-isopropylmalate dehydrogenase-like protein [Colletotrichum navitas]KAK1573056.1 3-isopropylmalate dehydrogenase-like protein [Colletotrichum navitas]
MAVEHDIIVFEGDYAGPEVVREGVKVLREVERQTKGANFNLKYRLIGGSSWDANGVTISQETLTEAASASAVLLGAVGGPKWSTAGVAVESGLGRLRKAMDAFGNLRPISFIAPSLVAQSALKPERCCGTNMMIVRELTGGMYFGEKTEHDGSFNMAADTDLYTRAEIERAARLAGKLATATDPPLPVISLDKANALASCGRLWRGVVSQIMAAEFPQVRLQHMLIDTAAMVMASNPTKLNGIVLTSNMFGDIISDEASAIVGSIGLLPSASLCDIPEDPIHGSAPDIAGKGIINPAGMILSVGMMFKYSLNMPLAAACIERAVNMTLESGLRTPDIGGSASTSDFGDAVVATLATLL